MKKTKRNKNKGLLTRSELVNNRRSSPCRDKLPPLRKGMFDEMKGVNLRSRQFIDFSETPQS